MATSELSKLLKSYWDHLSKLMKSYHWQSTIQISFYLDAHLAALAYFCTTGSWLFAILDDEEELKINQRKSLKDTTYNATTICFSLRITSREDFEVHRQYAQTCH